jgi:hypothetical protein
MTLGTLAISLPGTEEIKTGTSSVLLGGRYMLASRALAERVSATLRKMSLVSIRTTLPEGEALRLFAKLFEDVFGGFPVPLDPGPVEHSLQNLGTFREAT